MKKVLFVMADYPDWRQTFFTEWMSPRNRDYAKRHDFQYVELLKLPREKNGNFYRDNPTWLKFKIVKDWIDEGFLRDGDTVSHIDADICVVDQTRPFQTKKSFGYAIDSCNTHCMGAYTLNVNEWSSNMLNNLLDDQRFERLKNTPHWQSFREQACWYSMCGIQPHSWIPFTSLPNYGFHELQNREAVYSLEDLEKHVQIFPTEWNVTHVAGEGHNDYFMIPTHRKDTIFRHFAGGQRWQEEYFLDKVRDAYLSPSHLGTRVQSEEKLDF